MKVFGFNKHVSWRQCLALGVLTDGSYGVFFEICTPSNPTTVEELGVCVDVVTLVNSIPMDTSPTLVNTQKIKKRLKKTSYSRMVAPNKLPLPMVLTQPSGTKLHAMVVSLSTPRRLPHLPGTCGSGLATGRLCVPLRKEEGLSRVDEAAGNRLASNLGGIINRMLRTHTQILYIYKLGYR